MQLFPRASMARNDRACRAYELEHELERREREWIERIRIIHENNLKLQVEILQKENIACKQQSNELQQKLQQKEDGEKFILNRMEHLKRITCEQNCVLLTILFIYERALNITGLCVSQLERIIFTYARKVITIESEYLKCGKLMDVLIECGIAHELDGGKVYTPGALCNNGYDAWTKIMTIPDDRQNILILGRLHQFVNGIGHVEICDTRSRSRCKITMYDPQTKLDGSGRELSMADFQNHVKNDGGLKFFKIHVNTLKEVFNIYNQILQYNVLGQPS